MKVRWSKPARSDVLDIVARARELSPRYAETLADEFGAATERLARFPESGSPDPDYELYHLRRLTVRDYVLVYQVDAAQVFVVAVVHAARLRHRD